MEVFLLKTISSQKMLTLENGTQVKIEVCRTRTSKGATVISITYGSQRLEFSADATYEMHARTLAEMLKNVCDDACELPSDEVMK